MENEHTRELYPEENRALRQALDGLLPVTPTLAELQKAVDLGIGLATRELTSNLVLTRAEPDTQARIARGLVDIARYVHARREAERAQEEFVVEADSEYTIQGPEETARDF